MERQRKSDPSLGIFDWNRFLDSPNNRLFYPDFPSDLFFEIQVSVEKISQPIFLFSAGRPSLLVSGDIQKIRDIELEISETKERISALTTQVIREVQANTQAIKAVQMLFYDIISHAIFVGENTDDVKFTIDASSLNRTPTTIDIDIPKSKSLGKFVFKLLAYDLTVFLHTANVTAY